MYSKIAFSNVKKSIRDYTIYFLTLTFGICLFYMFNSVQAQQAGIAHGVNYQYRMTAAVIEMKNRLRSGKILKECIRDRYNPDQYML